MQDPFEGFQSGLNSPATQIFAVTPDDAADLETCARGICVATSGLVRMTTVDGTVGEIFVAAGVPFPVRVRRVWSTGTSATGIVGLS